MSAAGLMKELRRDDALATPLAGAMILEGSGAPTSDPFGDPCPGFIVVSPDSLAGVAPRIRQVAQELVGREVVVQFVTAAR